MADEKKPDDKPAATAPERKASPAPAAVASAPRFGARIVKRVQEPAATARAAKYPAGVYEVVHGTLTLGYEHPLDADGKPVTAVKPEAVVVKKGEHVQLTADEVAAIGDHGTVRLVSAAA